MSKISFSGKSVNINGKQIKCIHEVVEAFELKNVLIVLLDPDADMGKTTQYRNLIAYSLAGHQLWEAELPTPNNSDVYWKVSKEYPLVACSYSSHECEIDLLTGKISKTDFYK